MSFHEKSIWAMLTANVLVYGWYFSKMVNIAIDAPNAGNAIDVSAFAWYLVPTAIALIVVSIITRIAIAIHAYQSEGELNDAEDERDTLIKLRGENISGGILALCVVITIAMILFGNGPFWTANMLLAALILSETVAGIFKIIDYRRSF